jgi:hypothetical protein
MRFIYKAIHVLFPCGQNIKAYKIFTLKAYTVYAIRNLLVYDILLSEPLILNTP